MTPPPPLQGCISWLIPPALAWGCPLLSNQEVILECLERIKEKVGCRAWTEDLSGVATPAHGCPCGC